MIIKPPQKIELRESKIHGIGVFASQKIFKDEIIEECPYLSFPQKKEEKLPFFNNYTFSFPKGGEWEKHVMVMGYGSYYNHSTKPSVDWKTDQNKNTFVFYSVRDIEKDEELSINYLNGTEYP